MAEKKNHTVCWHIFFMLTSFTKFNSWTQLAMIQWIPYPSPWKYSKWLASDAYLQQTHPWLERIGRVVQYKVCRASVTLATFIFLALQHGYTVLGGCKGQRSRGGMITEAMEGSVSVFPQLYWQLSLSHHTKPHTRCDTSEHIWPKRWFCFTAVFLRCFTIFYKAYVMNTQFFILSFCSVKTHPHTYTRYNLYYILKVKTL